MTVSIGGMHCGACVQRVRKALEKVEGARVESVEIGSAVVGIDVQREAAVIDAVRKAGYEPRKSE
jgi:copper chaperone